MAYIGNKPANKAVVASDLDPAVITGQTALAVAPASTDEFLISDAGTLKRLDASLIGGANTPAFEASMSGNQNINSDTSTKVQFDTEVFDTASAYDHSSNYRFTPQTAGKYYVYCKIEIYGGSTNSLNTLFVQIKKNGSDHISSEHTSYPDNIMHKIFIYNAGIVDMNGSSDYVEAFAIGNGSESTQSIRNGTKACLFGAYKIIE